MKRLLKWICTVAGLLVVLAAAVCLKWMSVEFGSKQWRIGISGGSVALLHFNVVPFEARPWPAFGSFNSWSELADQWSSFGVRPKFGHFGPTDAWIIPLWMPFLLFVIPTVLLWGYQRRRRGSGYCPVCGYNLTGNTSGVCPECGRTTSKYPLSSPNPWLGLEPECRCVQRRTSPCERYMT